MFNSHNAQADEAAAKLAAAEEKKEVTAELERTSDPPDEWITDVVNIDLHHN